MSDLKILVTGANGFVGSHLIERLVQEDYDVTGLVGSSSMMSFFEKSKTKKVKIIKADLSQNTCIEPEEPIDVIVHTAARSPGVGVSVEKMVCDNVIATRNLVNYAEKAGITKIIFLSTLSIHGLVEEKVLNEQTPIHNPAPYGVSKFLCEQLLADKAKSIDSIAIRLPGIIGRNAVRNWLTRSLEASFRGEDIKVFNPSLPFNNAVHVNDLCEFITHLIGFNWSGSKAVCLGASGITTAGDVADLLAKETGQGSKVLVEEAHRPGFTICSDFAQTSFGYKPMEINTMLKQFCIENKKYKGIP
jgi:nucleoside-diphosphate-sugar epimerase